MKLQLDVFVLRGGNVSQDKFRVGIIARIKHGALLEAIRNRGWSQKQTAEFLGLSQYQFGTLINLRHVPKKPSDNLTRKLLELTGQLPEDLWPDFVRQPEFLKAEKTSEIYGEIIPLQLVNKEFLQLPPIQEEVVASSELKRELAGIMESLPQRLQEVIRMRFFEEKTYAEIGQHLNVSKERIRQIEAGALRKLKHPSKSQRLREFVN